VAAVVSTPQRTQEVAVGLAVAVGGVRRTVKPVAAARTATGTAGVAVGVGAEAGGVAATRRTPATTTTMTPTRTTMLPARGVGMAGSATQTLLQRRTGRPRRHPRGPLAVGVVAARAAGRAVAASCLRPT
jgi:hypothetical protein